MESNAAAAEPEEAAAPPLSPTSGLPLQLRRLASKHLLPVANALSELEQAGLSSVADIRLLWSAVVANLGSRTDGLKSPEEKVKDEYVTEYMAMSLWCWTPALWRSSAKPAKLMSPAESAAPDRAGSPPVPPDFTELRVRVQRRHANFVASKNTDKCTCSQKIKRWKQCKCKVFNFLNVECFEKWFDAMLAAGHEVDLLECATNMRCRGDGAAVFFSAMPPSDSSPQPPSPLARPKRLRPPVSPSANINGSRGLSAPVWPRSRYSKTAPLWQCSETFFEWHGSAAFPPPAPAAKKPAKLADDAAPEVAAAVVAKAGKRGGCDVTGKQSVIMLHLGGAGCGAGVATWRQLLAEHGIGADGTPQQPGGHGNVSVHFFESRAGRYVPRCIFADLDLNTIHTVHAERCFASTDLIGGKVGQQLNWAVARNQSDQMHSETLDALRRHAECVDYLAGIFGTGAMHGSVGGGFASGLLRDVASDFSKTTKWMFALAPEADVGGRMTPIWNAALSMQALIDHADITVLFDNAALQKVAMRKVHGLGIQDPSLQHYNGLIGRVVASCTGSLRLGFATPASEGWRAGTPKTMVTNLVPHPRLHFVMPSLGPVIDTAEPDCTPSDTGPLVDGCLTRGQLSSVNTKSGKTLALALLGRGVEQSTLVRRVGKHNLWDGSPSDMEELRRVFVSSYPAPVATDSETVCLHNSTGIGGLMGSWLAALDEGNSDAVREAYIGAGMAQGELGEAKEGLLSFKLDYEEGGGGPRGSPSGGDGDEDDVDAPMPERGNSPARASGGAGASCCVCLDTPREALLLPCQHYALCHRCARELKDQSRPCPLCRRKIKTVVRVYES